MKYIDEIFLVNFPEKNVLICLHHGWEGAENIFITSDSRIIDFSFCIAVLTSNTTIQTKFNKLICILICTFIQTSANNFF